MRTLAMITRRLVGAGGLLALLIGIPTALLHTYGLPNLGDVRPYLRVQAVVDALTSPVSDSAIAAVLVIALWIVWARFALAVLVQLPAVLAGARAPRIRLLGPEQALAAFLFAAIGLTPAAAAFTGAPAVAVPAASTSTVVMVQPPPAERPEIHQATVVTRLATRVAATPTITTAGPDYSAVPRFAAARYDGHLSVRVADNDRTVPVAKNDTLWDMAERYLDDPRRWREIYQLNRDRYDDNGHMRGGNHIEAGWHLQMPDDAAIDDHDRNDNARDATASQPPDQGAASRAPADTAPTGPTPSSPVPPPSGTAPATTPSTPTPSADSRPMPSADSTPAHRPGDDGVVEPSTATPGAPGGSAAHDGSTAANDEATSRPAPRPPAGINLPAGGWIDLGLAAAILAAVALIWAHRRRRYTHRPAVPQLRLREADTAALPATVTHLRRGLRRRSAPAPTGAEHGPRPLADEEPDAMPTPQSIPAGEPTRSDDGHLSASRDHDNEDDDINDEDSDNDEDSNDDDYFGDEDAPDDDVYGDTIDDELQGDTVRDGGVALDTAAPVSPALVHPVATLWPPAGLGLTGPGAEAAARGFLTAALATGGVDDPHARGRVVMSSATCATLLGADAVSLPTSPRLIITAGLSEALSLLEEHTLHRTRLVFDGEVDTVAALRDADPFTDPLPPVVLIADASALHERARVAALLTQGQRLDIHGILLGAWPDGDTVEVAVDGATTPPTGETVRHGAHPADVGRLSVLTPAQTTDLLQVLTEAHTGEPQPPAPTESPAVSANAAADGSAQTDSLAATRSRDDSGSLTEAITAEQELGHNEKKAGFSAAADKEEVPSGAVEAEQHDGVDSTDEQPEQQQGRVTVSLFGTPNLADRPVRPVFRLKAMELLAYLAVQDTPVHRDIVMEDILGDIQRGKAPTHLNTVVSNVRQVCKVTGGSGTYVHRAKDYFSLDGSAFDLDVWHLRDAITEARATDDPGTRIAVLRRAVDAYTGEFAHGCDYDWAEPYRQALRNQALDAAVDLADALTATGEHDQAADVLQAAMILHPYAEQLYQQAMRAHTARGDITAVRTVRRALTRQLAEIDAYPSDETVALADRLIASVQSPQRRSPRRAEQE